MVVTRRTALRMIAAGSAASLLRASQINGSSLPAGSETYQPRWESLQQHSCPDWYRDAKFGIYYHWGLYSVPAFGNEWYSHNMYLPGRPEYEHHLATYGPLRRFGYKNFAPAFTAEHFNADAWVSLFKEAGARYLGPVAEHADGFSMWDSQVNRWNAARMGPRRDTVGEMERAVRRQGLKFYASFHHQWLWGWYSSPVADADIYQPQFADLYWPQRYTLGTPLPKDAVPAVPGAFNYAHPDPPPSARFCEIWRDKVIEVVDRYHPDVIYFDSRSFIIPETYRMEMLAHYYNSGRAAAREVVMTYKEKDFATGSGQIDIEAGQLGEKASFVWQTDDVMDWNSWGYLTQPNYKSAGRILRQLIDVVSKNGNMLLDVGPRPDGTIPAGIEDRLRQIGAWLRVNGEAIYETRPWERFGEGPTRIKAGSFGSDRNLDLTAQDLRFTTRANAFYAHVLGAPGSQVRVGSLRRDRPLAFGTLRKVQMLGLPQPLAWEWRPEGLVVQMPETRPSDEAVVIKLS
ncbi:MAG: alpha-L-fucosidase [Terracidiphilus sp.]|nr:alpha-L-fucosidase [Terracidiphilus sp.]